MTENEIKEFKEKISGNTLYQKSCSIMKEYQFVNFSGEDGKAINGQESNFVEINGESKLALFNFKDGYLHSEENKPAVEYPMHWEYWNMGVIEKVVDVEKNVEELWENGIPIKIQKK